MNCGNVNNMPPVVSPASVNAMPNMMPNAMPNVMPNVMPNAMPNVTVTENIYMFPYAKPKPPVYSDAAFILVLFILLVIISRGVGFIGKC